MTECELGLRLSAHPCQGVKPNASDADPQVESQRRKAGAVQVLTVCWLAKGVVLVEVEAVSAVSSWRFELWPVHLLIRGVHI